MTDITLTRAELDARLAAASAAAMGKAAKVAQDYADHNFARAHKVKNPLKKQACLTKHIAGSHLSTTIRALAPTPTGWVCVKREKLLEFVHLYASKPHGSTRYVWELYI